MSIWGIYEARLWDTETEELIWQFHNTGSDASQISSVGISGDGLKFFISDLERVIVWDSLTLAEVGVFSRPERSPLYTRAIFLPDNKHLLVGGDSYGIQLWDIDSQQLLHIFPGIGQPIVSPNGEMFLSMPDLEPISWDLWNISTRQKLYNFPIVSPPEFSFDNQNLLTYEWDRGLGLWSLSDIRLQKILYPPQPWGVGRMFSPDSRFVLVRYVDTAYLIDINTNGIVHTFEDVKSTLLIYEQDSITAIKFLFDNDDGFAEVRVWSTVDYALKTKTMIQIGSTIDHAMSADGKYLVTVSSTHGVRLWDTDDFSTFKQLC